MADVGYVIEIEIYEAVGCGSHRAGQRLIYPDECESICPWLLDSMSGVIRVLRHGGGLPWRYAGSRYQGMANADDGTVTEFVRCPDPTGNGVVAKITRKALPERERGSEPQ